MIERRKYSKEFKLDAIEFYRTSGKKQRDVEAELGIGAGCISHWMREFEEKQEEAFPGKGNLSENDKILAQLQKENRQLKQEREILKKALGIFSKTPE